jgi:hypothetical protein
MTRPVSSSRFQIECSPVNLRYGVTTAGPPSAFTIVPNC